LSEERFESAHLLLICASLVACCFNDAFVASKDAADGLVNIVKIEGKRRAVDMHNVLLDCLCEEADEWLAGASEVIVFSYSKASSRIKFLQFQG
jgi:hypothetical protein